MVMPCRRWATTERRVTVPPVDPRAPQRVALRRAVLQLVMSVVLLDAAAMAIFYGADFAHGPSRTRNIFLIAWSIVTALLVGILLRRVRKVRWEGKSGRQ
jgi:hypothetical protein